MYVYMYTHVVAVQDLKHRPGSDRGAGVGGTYSA